MVTKRTTGNSWFIFHWLSQSHMHRATATTKRQRDVIDCAHTWLQGWGNPTWIKLRTGRVAAAAAKSLQSCLTLCNPRDGSPWSSPVPGILQARTPEWVAISFSNAWKWKVKVKSLSHVRLSETPWTAAHQAPPSMGFSRQAYWSGVPSPSLSWYVLLSSITFSSNLLVPYN